MTLISKRKSDEEVNPKTRKRREIKKKIIEFFGGSCEDCGYNECVEALDCHHINPKKKKFGIAALLRQTTHWPTILKEVKKCRLICCRCHKENHFRIKRVNLTRPK